MKKFLIISSLLISSALLFNSCEKEENKVTLDGSTPISLVGDKANTVIPFAYGQESMPAIQFNWNNPNYKFSNGTSTLNVTYTLEIDSVGGNFKSATKYKEKISSDLGFMYNRGKLNTVLSGIINSTLEPPPIRLIKAEARVIASIGTNVGQQISNAVKFDFTVLPPPPKVATPVTNELYIVGSATAGSWNNPVPSPSQKFTQLSVTKYELTLPLSSSNDYLILPQNGSWSSKFCIEDGLDVNTMVNGGDFVFKTSGGQNIKAPSIAGNYKLTFDFQKGKFTAVKL